MAGLFFLPLLCAGAGCSSSKPSPEGPASPHAGLTIRAACPDERVADLLRAYSAAWRSREQVRAVEVVAAGPEGPASVDGADVWVIPSDELPRLVSQERLRPLPASYQAREDTLGWMSLLPLYREHLTLWGRDDSRQSRAFGLPVLGEGPLCCYRSDWLADEGHQAAFEKRFGRKLAPPQTWRDVEQIAAYFADPGGSGQPGPSLPPLPADDRDLERLFYQVASGYVRRAVSADEAVPPQRVGAVFGFHFDPDTGAPRIAAPGFVRALELLHRLQAFRPPQPGAEPEAAFRAGKAVLCVSQAAWVGRFQDRASAVRDRFGVLVVPGGEGYYTEAGAFEETAHANQLPYLGAASWLGVVPATARHPEAAFSLLADLAGRDTSAQIVLEPRWGGGVLRTDQLEQRARWDSFDLDPARTADLRDALAQTLLHRRLKNPVICLRVPDTQLYRQALVPALRQVLLEGKEPAGALEEVSRCWAELIQARGAGQHRRDVRISLGLLPD